MEFYVAQVLLNPDIQPFAHRCFGWSGYFTLTDIHSGLTQFLNRFTLSFSRDRALNLFPGTRIKTNGIAALPIGILLFTAANRFLSDGTCSCCIMLCYINTSFEWMWRDRLVSPQLTFYLCRFHVQVLTHRITGDAYVSANADGANLVAVDQGVCRVSPNAQDGHQIIHYSIKIICPENILNDGVLFVSFNQRIGAQN